jgi:hypothetical protein
MAFSGDLSGFFHSTTPTSGINDVMRVEIKLLTANHSNVELVREFYFPCQFFLLECLFCYMFPCRSSGYLITFEKQIKQGSRINGLNQSIDTHTTTIHIPSQPKYPYNFNLTHSNDNSE